MQSYKTYQSVLFQAHAVLFFGTWLLQWATQGGVEKERRGDWEAGIPLVASQIEDSEYSLFPF